MVQKCSLKHCGNSEKKGLRFHILPNDPVQKQRWIDEIEKHGGLRMSRGKQLKYGFKTKVCGDHFTYDNYTFGLSGTKRSMLLPSAIPSKFPSNEKGPRSPEAKRKKRGYLCPSL